MEIFDAVIIGAGPAGLFGGITCAAGGLRTCILEKNGSAGKKLLVSGSGRCNMTHSGPVEEFMRHYGPGGKFIKPAFMNFTNRDLIDFFRERNLRSVELDNGKIFPETMKSSDVLEVLLKECRDSGAVIRYHESVTGIARAGAFFEITTERGSCKTGALLIATGGKSYPGTGSTGDGYLMAEKLGHSITELRPALTSIIIKNFQFTGCSGISVAGSTLTLYRDGKKIIRGSGDVLFTHRGLSGPGVLDFSRYMVPGDVLGISLVPFHDRAVFEKKVLHDFTSSGKKLLRSCIMRYHVPERLVDTIFSIAGIPADMKASHTDKKTRNLLIGSLMDYTFTVDSLVDYNEAMVTKGGIPLHEVNKNTMESKLAPGLFFAGEIIDIDGDTGGYNLQFAFSSGVLAGMNMKKKGMISHHPF